VVIDLVCYRRHGHNEADEPAATQPLMYRSSAAGDTRTQAVRRPLIERGLVDEGRSKQAMMADYRDKLDKPASRSPTWRPNRAAIEFAATGNEFEHGAMPCRPCDDGPTEKIRELSGR
jgi:2-oxoglutarate dehydrogenase complex dehydrogenase (E1) component-like enzyme